MALIEAKSRGIDVPGRVSVTGYGELSFAADTDPALTTFRIDAAAIGSRAAEMLVARITGTAPTSRVADLGFSLIERASV